ncbi:hypothetical protein EJB05_18578, partial [Eragrostis curvula]
LRNLRLGYRAKKKKTLGLRLQSKISTTRLLHALPVISAARPNNPPQPPPLIPTANNSLPELIVSIWGNRGRFHHAKREEPSRRQKRGDAAATVVATPAPAASIAVSRQREAAAAVVATPASAGSIAVGTAASTINRGNHGRLHRGAGIGRQCPGEMLGHTAATRVSGNHIKDA